MRKLVKYLRLDELIDTDGSSINNVSFLKPTSPYTMNLSIMIYDSPEMTQPIGISFDSAHSDCSAYIEALLVNNTSNTGGSGTQWMKPIGSGATIGFGTEYNNAPVVVHMRDWMLNTPSLSSIVQNFTDDTRLYLRQEWYYMDEGVKHVSDMYSQVVPANTEQTAFKAIAEQQNAQVQNAQVQNGNVNNASFTDGMFIALPDVLNIVTSPMFMDDNDEDHNIIQLKNYSQGHTYDIKFSVTGTQQLQLVFVDDVGQTMSSIDTASLELIPGHEYVIRTYAGFADVLHERLS